GEFGHGDGRVGELEGGADDLPAGEDPVLAGSQRGAEAGVGGDGRLRGDVSPRGILGEAARTAVVMVSWVSMGPFGFFCGSCFRGACRCVVLAGQGAFLGVTFRAGRGRRKRELAWAGSVRG